MRVHMSGWRKYPLLMMVLMVPALSSCSATRPEGDKDMVVLEWPDGEPIAGAIVVATWEGQESVPGEAFSVCYHVETSVTAADGSFRIPAYVDFHPSVSDKWLSVRVYKAGYRESIDTSNYERRFRGSLKTGRFYLEKDASPRAERLRALRRFFDGTLCANAGASRRNYYRLYEALAHEAASLAVTPKEKSIASGYDEWAKEVLKPEIP